MVETAAHSTETKTGIRGREPSRASASSYAVRITLSGHVQGVGFRPFVYRLAGEYGLRGFVQNRGGDVDIVACGRHAVLQKFRRDLIVRAPPLARPEIVKLIPVDTTAFEDFEIVPSSVRSEAQVLVPPDYFMCEDCRRELGDPGDRRYRYPFISCTQCGPRYTLIERLPYVRPNTSMAGFALCEDCEADYRDPANRRFHAESVACPNCGPELFFEQTDESPGFRAEAALDAALGRLRAGGIVAVKGIGGYDLMCDARDPGAVAALRRRKRRPAKPLAVMFPLSGPDGLDDVRRHAILHDAETDMLTSPVRPIVLAARRHDSDLASNIAPQLRELGVFLPYSPLHQLLLQEFAGPLVATSGNVSGEPVLTANDDAAARLSDVADAFLHHDRPIVRAMDDSVYRGIAGRMRPLRIGRGCAPLELELPWRQRQPLLAVGGRMKGTVALSWDNRVVVSPHLGEMSDPRSLAVFEQVAADLQALYGVEAERIACDAHPDYTTHRWAMAQDALPVDRIRHHHAHASAAAAELGLPGQWLIFTWDDAGFGEDGSLWGGEAFIGAAGHWKRVGSLRTFRLPGGERATREPWRSAAALHWECGRRWTACLDRNGLVEAAWKRQLDCPVTSAAGRLFDAAAVMIADRTHASFEAEGPMVLESLCRVGRDPVYLSLNRGDDGIWRSDWQPLLSMLADDSRDASTRAEIFHSSLAHVILQQARRIRDEHNVDQVGLCGGVFQNRVLAEQAVEILECNRFRVCLPARLPCNEAALSFGQAAEIAARGAGD